MGGEGGKGGTPPPSSPSSSPVWQGRALCPPAKRLQPPILSFRLAGFGRCRQGGHKARRNSHRRDGRTGERTNIDESNMGNQPSVAFLNVM